MRSWTDTLAAFYDSFPVPPWSRRITRALRKEAKTYLWDWSELESSGARFENLVAVHLLGAVRRWTETAQAKLSLYYVRDKQKREVDFLIADRGEPILLVECKRGDADLSPHLLRFQRDLDLPIAVQVVEAPGHRQRTEIGGRVQWVASADAWLGKLS